MSGRMDKVNHHLQRIISDIVLKELDFSLGCGFLFTVTSVECSPDLHNADVYISVLGNEKKIDEGFKLICRSLKTIQRIMASRISLKYTPKLYLKLDKTAFYAQKIDRLIDKVKKVDDEKE